MYRRERKCAEKKTRQNFFHFCVLINPRILSQKNQKNKVKESEENEFGCDESEMSFLDVRMRRLMQKRVPFESDFFSFRNFFFGFSSDKNTVFRGGI